MSVSGIRRKFNTVCDAPLWCAVHRMEHARGPCPSCVNWEVVRKQVRRAIRAIGPGSGIETGLARVYQASLVRELEDEAQRLIEERELEIVMAFTKSARETPFITETPGDYLLGIIMDLETYEKSDGGTTEYLLVRSFEPKTTENPEPAERLFRVMGLDVIREYKRRLERSRKGIKGAAAACKYLYAVCTGVNARGYAELELSFSDDKEDMAKMREEKNGVYYVLHLKERTSAAKPATKGGTTAGTAASAPEDDDIPF